MSKAEMQPLICSQCGSNQFGRIGPMLQCIFCDTIFLANGINLPAINPTVIRIPKFTPAGSWCNDVVDTVCAQEYGTVFVVDRETFDRALRKLKDSNGAFLIEPSSTYQGLTILGSPLIIE